jgi:hypothetical protein
MNSGALRYRFTARAYALVHFRQSPLPMTGLNLVNGVGNDSIQVVESEREDRL